MQWDVVAAAMMTESVAEPNTIVVPYCHCCQALIPMLRPGSFVSFQTLSFLFFHTVHIINAKQPDVAQSSSVHIEKTSSAAV
jgi:hypothetical protein